MKKAIRAIIDQTCTDVNICLILDALDEYDGNYIDIAAFLKDLVSMTNIKICLLSWWESLLIDLFGSNPGFQIHEHTLGDISIYVRSRLEDHLRMSWPRTPALDLTWFYTNRNGESDPNRDHEKSEVKGPGDITLPKFQIP